MTHGAVSVSMVGGDGCPKTSREKGSLPGQRAFSFWPGICFILIVFKIYFFIFDCVCVWGGMGMCMRVPVSLEGRRGCWISLELKLMELKSSARAVNAVNH